MQNKIFLKIKKTPNFLSNMCAGRSLNVKKNDGIKESTDSSTIEDEDTKGGSQYPNASSPTCCSDNLSWSLCNAVKTGKKITLIVIIDSICAAFFLGGGYLGTQTG